MAQLWLFVSALMAHWLFTFGGAALVAFGLYEKFQHKETHKRVYWGAAVVLLVVASYQAWQDEHNNTEHVIADKQQLAIENGGLKAQTEEQKSEIEYLRNHQMVSVTPNINIPPSSRPAASIHLQKIESSYTLTDAKGNKTPVVFSIGRPISLNLYYNNLGTDIARNATGVARLYIAQDRDKQTERKLAQEFTRYADAKLSQDAGSTIPPGGVDDQIWFTAQTEANLTQVDVDAFNTGKDVLYLFSFVRYTDGTGKHYTHFCQVTQPPAFNPEIWHYCSLFEDQK